MKLNQSQAAPHPHTTLERIDHLRGEIARWLHDPAPDLLASTSSRMSYISSALYDLRSLIIQEVKTEDGKS